MSRTPTLTLDPITAALGTRATLRSAIDGVAEAREALHAELAICREYQGGLPAELAAGRERRRIAKQSARQRARQAVLARRGRPIDLPALLRQRRPDGLPLWSVVDPAQPISSHNGQVDSDGTIGIGGTWRRLFKAEDPHRPRKGHVPTGLPPIPERARHILRDQKNRRRATWIGVLYQPDAWREINPDPAIVVEWRDLPGRYFALAVWGADRPAIMEFVH